MVQTWSPPALGAAPPTAAGTSCAHCTLPVPAGRLDPSQAEQFCCDACRAVYAAIHELGLDEYYDLRAQAGARQPAEASGKRYEEFDDPAFLETYGTDLPDGLRRVELYLSGVHCSACVWLVERVPRVLPGLVQARLDFGRSLVELIYDPAQVRLSQVAHRLDSFGYVPRPPRAALVHAARQLEDRALLGRIAVAGAVAGNVMLMAFALYSGLFQGIEADYEQLLRWGSLLVASPAVAWCARPFFRGAWAALRTRTAHLDLPISIGVLAGYGWGAWNTLTSSGEIYFDTVTTLIFLLLVGRWIQRRQQRRAHDVAELLYSLAPAQARLVEGGVTREVPLGAVQRGALVEIWSGERVPVDGVITAGSSSLDISLLTGESRPETLGPGGRVHAGSVNLSSPLRVRVEQTGESTRIGQLLRTVEQAARRRAPVVQLANRISGYFVVAVLALAALTFALWLPSGAGAAIDHVVALLVVTCPCALGMATPLALSVALGRSARAGILVKGGDILERLAKPGLVVFDKTGTLTEGRHALTHWLGAEHVKPLLVAAESRANHPIAHAVRRALPVDPALTALDVEHVQGGGLTATVAGQRLLVGSPAFVAARIALPEWARSAAAELAREGTTPVLVAVDGSVAALAGFGDPIRPDAAASLERLAVLGYELAILSGDHQSVVDVVAGKLGARFAFTRGGATPEQKLELVERLGRSRTVVMIGDGVNDAAALAAAGVGVAVHGGAEASLAAADVFLTRPGLAPILELVLGARRSLAAIRRGLGFSLLYNALGVALAVSGVLTPLVAAVLMPLSSLTVLTCAFRARTFDKEREP